MTDQGGNKFIAEAAHWYHQDATPQHEVIAKNGKPRPTTLRDARKLNLSPSFSGCAAVLAAPPLEAWKRNTLLSCAAETPRDPLEGDQSWMDRVMLLYKERTETARDLGTKIHGEIQRALTDTVWIPSPHAIAAIAALKEWCGLDSIISEATFAHPLGYGGLVDAHKEGFIADFKTKEFAEGDLPKTYDNHSMQLAAYREGLGMSYARCAIIYVSTSVQELTHTVEIDQLELNRGWDMFELCVNLWQLKNKYEPLTELVKAQQEVWT